jgi:hypothetical protein
MSKSTKTMMCVAGSLLLLSALTMAQTAAKNSGQDKTKQQPQQHSRLSKAAFWRHHPNSTKNATNAKVTPASSKQSKAKSAEVKPVSAKQGATNKVATTKDQKPAQHASTTKPATKKAPVAKKVKSQPIKDSEAAPLKR